MIHMVYETTLYCIVGGCGLPHPGGRRRALYVLQSIVGYGGLVAFDLDGATTPHDAI